MGQEVTSCQQCENELQQENGKNKNCCEICCGESEKDSQNPPLQPITFSEKNSSDYEDTKEVSYQLSKMNSNQPEMMEPKLSLIPEEIVIVNRFDSTQEPQLFGAEKYQAISVPFSVIKLTLSSFMMKQIEANEKDFFKLHENPCSQFYNTWKLQPTGFYTNFIKDHCYLIISDKYFYKGNCSVIDNKYQLNGKGVLITNFGTYRGHFRDSKAHGKGDLFVVKERKLCEGIWEAGSLQKGSIENPLFLYTGELRNGVPHGEGKLKIKNKEIRYEGKFSGGKFSDQNGLYACPDYEYQGGFLKGKKSGKGVLQELSKSKETNKRKRRQLLRLAGKWENDALIEEDSK